jgi:hypothetical protein
MVLSLAAPDHRGGRPGGACPPRLQVSARLALAFSGLLAATSAGCSGSSIEDLQGSWAGQIVCCAAPSGVPPSCQGDTSEISLGLLVGDGKIHGDSQIRTKGSNTNFEIAGSQSTVDRLVDCPDTPTCGGDSDCAAVLDQTGKAGASRCLQGFCSPCFTHTQQPLVRLTLRRESWGRQFPELELWRYGDALMEGTINGYCPNLDPRPLVSVTKRWQEEGP